MSGSKRSVLWGFCRPIVCARSLLTGTSTLNMLQTTDRCNDGPRAEALPRERLDRAELSTRWAGITRFVREVELHLADTLPAVLAGRGEATVVRARGSQELRLPVGSQSIHLAGERDPRVVEGSPISMVCRSQLACWELGRTRIIDWRTSTIKYAKRRERCRDFSTSVPEVSDSPFGNWPLTGQRTRARDLNITTRARRPLRSA